MDIRLHYKEAGQGFPLILLHGNGEDLTYFRRQIPVFAQIAHVFAPDTRGHGQTPRGKAPFTLAQFADDLGAFMDSFEGILRCAGRQASGPSQANRYWHFCGLPGTGHTSPAYSLNL